MESFLSTLPSYVHDYLNKQPPTDVFHVLRELICFAVLYSNDRAQIASRTTELLEKGADKTTEEGSNGENGDAESSIQGDDCSHDKHLSTTTTDTVSTATDKGQKEEVETNEHADDDNGAEEKAKTAKPRDKSHMLYTFPEWWGHHDGTEEKNDTKKTLSHEPKTVEYETRKPVRRETVGTWVPWDDPAKKVDAIPARRTTSIAPSDLIPNLRSYPDPSRRPTATPSPPASRASVTPKTTPPRRSSTQVPASSAPAAAAAPKCPSPASMGRTGSTYRPAMTATVRARQEHAKAKEQKLEEEKTKASQLNRTSSRLKQQARPSVDWESIKRDRRRTMPVMPNIPKTE